MHAQKLSVVAGVLAGGVVLARLARALVKVNCAVETFPARHALALVCVNTNSHGVGRIDTCSTILARIALALVDVNVTVEASPSLLAGASIVVHVVAADASVLARVRHALRFVCVTHFTGVAFRADAREVATLSQRDAATGRR